jgi:hypothetical protein
LTDDLHDIDSQVRALARSLGEVLPRGQAAIFGACARALAPLVGLVEQRSKGAWSFPDLEPAMTAVEQFALGSAEAANHVELRSRLAATAPHGDDLDSPWSTYVQDVIICTDAGLAAASVDLRPDPIWIQFALEPLMSSLQNRDVEVLRARGEDHWAASVLGDPVMASALAFLQRSITRLLRDPNVDQPGFLSLVEEARVLCPP